MSLTHSLPSVIIVGGGSAGWMSAALLSRMFQGKLNILLVESAEVGTIGVGEASIPPLTLFNQALGIDEATFLRRTNGSIKLGIEFQGWGDADSVYMHAFGAIGKDLGLIPFHQLWLSQRLSGAPCRDFWDYSFNRQAAASARFAPLPQIQGTPLSGLTHAYHFDASLYGQCLRSYSEARGVKRIEGHVAEVLLATKDGAKPHPASSQSPSESPSQSPWASPLTASTPDTDTEPHIAAIRLTSGETLRADFFIDCSGQRALLIEGALKAGFEDYSAQLPCNRAIAVPCARSEPLLPYTQSIAFAAGWRWRIPLSHRTGNGVVYSSEFMTDDQAETLLFASLDGKALAEPNRIRFTTGRRARQWSGNCIAIGLASGFLEPLESTSIHLVQSALLRLVRYFPAASDYQANRAAFNAESKQEFEEIRDFILLHYVLNRRQEPFWQQLAAQPLPDSLKARMALFAQSGTLERHSDELFSPLAWQQVLLGQGIKPAAVSLLASTVPAQQISEYLDNIYKIQQQALTKLPSHADYLASIMAATE